MNIETCAGLKRAGFILLGFYLFLLVMLGSCQRSFIYYPSRASEEQLVGLAGREGFEPWKNASGDIIGWVRRGADVSEGPMVLVFHGNAGFALYRSYFGDGLMKTGRVSGVYIMEYPGYGSRDGNPSQKSFLEAAEMALEQLRSEGSEEVLLLGESIGAGVACGLAASNPAAVSGLFLITPFTSLADVGAEHYRFLPVRLLLEDTYPAAEWLEAYHGPILFLVAGRDEVIPTELGMRLHEGYSGPKKLLIQEKASHNTVDYTPGAPWWKEAVEFLVETPAAE